MMLEPKKCVVHADAASQLQRPQQLLASRRFELSSYFERVRGHFSPLSQLTPKVSRPLKAGRLERKVSPEGSRAHPGLKSVSCLIILIYALKYFISNGCPTFKVARKNWRVMTRKSPSSFAFKLFSKCSAFSRYCFCIFREIFGTCMFFYLIRRDLTHRIKAIQPRMLILNVPYGFLAVFNFRS